MELKNLRMATEIQHRKVEKDLDLLRSSLTLDHYVALLERFYGFHRLWEPEVATILETELPGFFAPRGKLQNIEADLLHFGCRTEDLSRIASCCNLPSLQTVGAALGSLYVIEGSSLGGRILTRHFSEHLGLQRQAGCRFFAGYEERTGPMWATFGELMAARPPTEDDDMLKAAVDTFESLGEWLGNVHV